MTWSFASLRLPVSQLRSRLRLPRLPRRLPRLRLRVTALTTAVLLAAPALVLLRMPRPRAEGLGRLLPHAGLLQSFPSAPERQPPPLWQQRLDAPTAQLLWRQQRQLWWQFWTDDQAGGAYLVMPLPRQIRLGALPPPPHSLQVDGLLVVPSGPQALRSLQTRLVQASRRQEGLQQRCLELLEREPAAYWSSQGIEAMTGPLAPLLTPLQEGCLALELAPAELLFSGEAGVRGAPPELPPSPSVAADLPEPIGEGLLLHISGRSLDLLLAGLLSRKEVREAVQSVYGLGESELALLQGPSFDLRLRPQLAGPFQAGLELVLPVEGDPAPWIAILDGLGQRLQARGLLDDPLVENPSGDPTAPPAPVEPPEPGSGALVSTTWRDGQGREVGGWRWLTAPGQPLRLLLFLGPEPEAMALAEDAGEAPAMDGAAAGAAPAGAAGPLPLLTLQARPRALAALNLLPGQLPLPLLQARQLLLVADDGAAGAGDGAAARGLGISRLLGRLQLGELLPPQPPVPPPSGELPPGESPDPAP
jgi:hypothetical protein